MRRIFVFMNISVDGYIEGPRHDISWSHGDSEPFAREQGGEVDAILLGRRTYEMMRSFWPTPQAAQVAPETARFMNEKPKFVASHRMFEPGWRDVTVIAGDVIAGVRKLKEHPGKSIAIFGSNTLSTGLVDAGLIDEFQLMVNPIVLGEGTSLFKGLAKRAQLRLAEKQTTATGAVLLTYQGAEAG